MTNFFYMLIFSGCRVLTLKICQEFSPPTNSDRASLSNHLIQLGLKAKRQVSKPLTMLLRKPLFLHCSEPEDSEVWVETLSPSTWACESTSIDLLFSNFPHIHLKPAVSQCTNDNKHVCDGCVFLPARRTRSFIPLRPSPIIFLPPKQRSSYVFFL